MEISHEAIAVSAVASVVLILLLHRQFTASKLPLPPGPKPRFFSGNVHQLPSSMAWLTYASWSKLYGDYPLLFLNEQAMTQL